MERSLTIDNLLTKMSALGEEERNSILSAVIKTMANAISEKSLTNIVEHYNGVMSYNNYLSEAEAMDICEKFKNDDGSEGARWTDADVFFEKAEDAGAVTEYIPYYNKWAFYAVANMIVSDYGNVISKFAEGDEDKYFQFVLDLTIARLKDVDNPHFVRSYFNL